MEPKSPTIDRSTILVVDDHVEILDFVVDDVSEHYEVLQAENGKQALEVLAAHPVQLVVSGVMMPEMDGYELCQRIKSDLAHSHIPIILLTAKNTLKSKIEGLEQGADAYIEKPFSPEHLQAQIGSLLANRNKIRAYFSNSPWASLNSLAPTNAVDPFVDELK